jgi:magnesium transporter
VLINCAAYRDGSKLADITVAEIGRYLAREEGFVWVALQDPSAEELAEMKAEFGLHALAVEDTRHGHQRPKIEEYGASLFVVLHLVEIDPANAQQVHVGEVAIFAGRNHVLSVRNRSEHGFREVRERCEREPGLLRLGPGFVLYAVMDAVVDRYFPVIDALECELEAIEQKIFATGGGRKNIELLYDLKRRATVLKHAVAPLLEGTGKLHGSRIPRVCAGVEDYFRDVANHLSRINGQIDAMRETIGTAIQVNLSMVTIEETEVTKRLAAWASIFAVCTAFAGVWGMNFEQMPELRWRYGYLAALTLIGTVCSLLYWRFRRAGWL